MSDPAPTTGAAPASPAAGPARALAADRRVGLALGVIVPLLAGLASSLAMPSAAGRREPEP